MPDHKPAGKPLFLSVRFLFFYFSRFRSRLNKLFRKTLWRNGAAIKQGASKYRPSVEKFKEVKMARNRELIDIVENLKSVGQQVKVRITGDITSHTSKITAFNIEHGMVVIEAFQSITTPELLYGRPVILEASCEGEKLHLPCSFVESLVPNLGLGYQLKLSRASYY